MGYRADVLAVVFSAPEKAAVPKGQHLGQLQEVAAAKLQDARSALIELSARTAAGANKDAIDVIAAALA